MSFPLNSCVDKNYGEWWGNGLTTTTTSSIMCMRAIQEQEVYLLVLVLICKFGYSFCDRVLWCSTHAL